MKYFIYETWVQKNNVYIDLLDIEEVTAFYNEFYKEEMCVLSSYNKDVFNRIKAENKCRKINNNFYVLVRCEEVDEDGNIHGYINI